MVAAPPAATAAMRRGFLVPEIRPLDQYDGARARSAASLAWAIATGYGGAGNVPEELRDPFYTDQYEQEHLKPPVTRLLLTSDIYCRAWRHALGPATPPATPLATPSDNAALLALLGHRGLPPTFQDTPVRPADLQQRPIKLDTPVRPADLQQRPIKLGAHLALIDSLMAAFVTEATRGLGPPPGAPPGPHSWEQKILCWLDTVNRKLQESTEIEGNPPPDGPAAPPACAHKCPTRWYWKLVPHAIAFCLKESGNKPPVIRYRKDAAPPRAPPGPPPVLALQDLASGGALAAAIHYYCPQALRIEEVALSEPLSLAQRLHNLGLVREFGQRHLGTRCPLALEDLLYMPPALKLNVGAFLAELFLCFEVLRPPFVRPRQGGGSESPATSDSPTPKSSSPGFNFRHPLLAGGAQSPPSLRGSTGTLPHSPSLPHGDSFTKGWSKKPLSHPLSQAVSFSIPFGLDSDVDIVMGKNPLISGGSRDPLPRSASSDSLAAPHPRHHSLPHKLPHKFPPSPPEPPPSIEEALQIIHSSERLLPDGAPDAFYLHSPDPPNDIGDPPPNSDPLIDTPDPQNPPDPPKTPISAPPPSRTMTNFAERKKKLEEAAITVTPIGGVPALSGGSPQTYPPQNIAGGPPEGLSAEMSQLGARLEEKRRAIEAQKRRIEAIFAKHRQRLGRSAFLQLHGGDHEDDAGGGEASKDKKQVTFAPPVVPTPRYEAAVAKLSSALDSLQSDMERLSRQQQRLLRDPPGHAWIIPVAKSQGGTVPPPPKGGTPAATKTPGSPSPARKAGGTTPRKTPPPPPAPRSPRRARPVELKLPPLNRVLTPPHDVDTLPHLRRFSPSSVPVQTRCSIHFDDDIGDNGDGGDGDNRAGAVVAKPPPPDSPEPPELGTGGVVDAPRPMGTPRVSGDGTSDASSPGERREVTVTRGDEDDEEEEEEEEEEEGLGDSLEGSPTQGGGGRDTRSSMGFFFTDECPHDVPVSPRRAGFLERQRHREETRQRHQSGGDPARDAPDPPRPPVEEGGSRRGGFTRQEYERRQQLKLMDELDKVLRPPRGPPRAPRPPRGPRGPRACDDSALNAATHKGLLGSRLSKVYSQSSLSLSTVGHEPGGGTPSRAVSPSAPLSPGRVPTTREWENESNASSPASGPEYTGPRLYKEPSAKSNKHIIHNALAHCCLAGRVNEPLKLRVLQEVEKSSAHHFLILFREGGCQFRALYTLEPGDPPELRRLAGGGPRAVPLPMVKGIFKYNSDQKRFSQIPAKTMSMSVDAFTIQSHPWPPRKPPTPKKGTPK